MLLSLVELGALMLRWRNRRYAGAATIAAAVAGVASLLPLYETAEHGGELVYGYAGGVGLRSGDPADVNRLYIAGVYHQAMQDREAGRGLEGADLVDRAAQRFPDHLELQLMAIEWTTDVRKDPGTALQRLESVQIRGTMRGCACARGWAGPGHSRRTATSRARAPCCRHYGGSSRRTARFSSVWTSSADPRNSAQ